MEKKHVSLYSAMAIVVANIIGVGVFTSLGYQVQDITNAPALILLWVVGGIIALSGALVYGEIGTAFPKSGGEYQYLTRLYHPFVGFLSGWVSATVAFAAPVAAAAMALGAYSHKVFPEISAQGYALGVVILITGIHATTLNAGFRFQNVFTTLKVTLVIIFIIIGLSYENKVPLDWTVNNDTWKSVFSGAFAVNLVYVAYAYSGWNAASYLAGEIKNPIKNLPVSLLGGTLIVLFLYVLLNTVFLQTIPISELAAEQARDFNHPVEVGYFSADRILGNGGANAMALVISFLLVSTISAMIIAGPRVTHAMGQDFKIFGILGKSNKKGIPAMAIIGQSTISIILIITASFDQILKYVGFTLQLFTFLTVAGVFILRYQNKQAGNYKTPGFPFTPIIFLSLSAWSLYYIAIESPKESLYGLATLAVGALLYMVSHKQKLMSHEDDAA